MNAAAWTKLRSFKWTEEKYALVRNAVDGLTENGDGEGEVPFHARLLYGSHVSA